MRQDTHVDTVDDIVRPELPVRGGPQSVLIPGSAFETRSAVRKRCKQELAPLGNKETTQVRRIDLGVRGPLLQAGRNGAGRRNILDVAPG